MPDPPGVTVVKVETAREMLAAVEQALPADCAIFAAAVADWRVRRTAAARRSRSKDQAGPSATSRRRWLVENPDILATIAQRKAERPRLVIGFAAETENVRRQRQGQTRTQGLRLDRRQRRVARDRRRSAAISTACISSPPTASDPGRRSRRTRSRARSSARIAAALMERPVNPGKQTQSSALRLPHAAGLPLPAYQSELAAGLDLLAAVPTEAPVTMAPGRPRAMIPTGIQMALPPGTEGQMRPRSGLAARHGISVLNAPGTVDADYRGRDTGAAGQSRPRSIHGRARNADCTTCHCSDNAS